MRPEALVVLGFVLLVWVLGTIGRWVRREMERQSSDLRAADCPEDSVAPVTCPPAPHGGAVTPDESMPHGVREEPVAVSRIVSGKRLPRHSFSRVRYRNPHAVREGIVMMTVLGSCKALEIRKEPWLSDG